MEQKKKLVINLKIDESNSSNLKKGEKNDFKKTVPHRPVEQYEKV